MDRALLEQFGLKKGYPLLGSGCYSIYFPEAELRTRTVVAAFFWLFLVCLLSTRCPVYPLCPGDMIP